MSKIEKMLEDWDPRVKEASLKAFGKLGTKDDIPKIQGMLDDIKVRSATYNAIKEILQRYELLNTFEILPKNKLSQLDHFCIK